MLIRLRWEGGRFARGFSKMLRDCIQVKSRRGWTSLTASTTGECACGTRQPDASESILGKLWRPTQHCGKQRQGEGRFLSAGDGATKGVHRIEIWPARKMTKARRAKEADLIGTPEMAWCPSP